MAGARTEVLDVAAMASSRCFASMEVHDRRPVAQRAVSARAIRVLEAVRSRRSSTIFEEAARRRIWRPGRTLWP